jgi:tetratricopeptide (TPR) repeat protein
MHQDPHVSDCLDDSTTFAFVEGTLDPSAEAAVKQHIDGCADCRALVSHTAKSMRQDAPKHDESDVRPGGAIGRYRVQGVIGTGAMGVVYSAYDPELDRLVAMKLLRADALLLERAEDLQTRLLREARAMARLSHENVVAVYDTGTFEGRVFLAMELVPGTSLSVWLTSSPRRWQEVLERYVSAGRGLSAAHTAGLVHRDFKPDNVLVGTDGRVRVTDFGLARPVVPLPAESTRALESSARLSFEPGGGAHALETRPGVVAGTPAYMAPEQLLGKPADERSDQFSFAVALYEGLYGERPFGAPSMEGLAVEILSGRVREPPKDSRVPGWVRHAVLRGLRAAPAERYPSMASLLSSLERRTWRMRRRVFIPATVCLAFLGGFVGYRFAVHERAPVCRGAEARLTGVWDAKEKREGESAFLATHAPYAAFAWATSARILDDYAKAWVAMRTDACEATRVRAEQSEEVLELRVGCLEDRLRTVAALTKLFGMADAKVAERAVDAVQSLPPLETCSNVAALRAGVPPPRDTSTATGAAEVRSLIAEASALERAGKYNEGLGIATTSVTRARALAYLPVEAEALHELGLIQGGRGDSKEAEATLEEAAAVAEAGSHHEVAARAWIDLAYFIGVGEARFDRGERWLRYAAVAIDRLGGNEVLEAERIERLGLIDDGLGRPEEAMRDFERALALFRKNLGPADGAVAKTLDAMAVVEFERGHYDASRELDTRALALDEEVYGRLHPSVALDLNNRANSLWRLDRYDEALVDLHRSLDILERTLGPDHADIFVVLDSLGNVLVSRSSYDEALAVLTRARSVLEKAGRAALPDYATVLNDLGHLLRERGSFGEALALHEQALGVLTAALGPAHPDVAMTHVAIAETWLDQGKFHQALEEARKAMPDVGGAVGGEASNTAKVLTVLGEATLGLPDVPEARKLLERAIVARERLSGEAADGARVRFALARALWSEGEKPRAITLAKEARQTYSERDYFKHKLAVVDGWLTTHPG